MDFTELDQLLAQRNWKRQSVAVAEMSKRAPAETAAAAMEKVAGEVKTDVSDVIAGAAELVTKLAPEAPQRADRLSKLPDYLPMLLHVKETPALWLVQSGEEWYLETDLEKAREAEGKGATVDPIHETAGLAPAEASLQVAAALVPGTDATAGNPLYQLAIKQDQASACDITGATGEGMRVVDGQKQQLQLYPEELFDGRVPTPEELIAHQLDANPDGTRQNRILLLVHGTFSNTHNLIANFVGHPGDGGDGVELLKEFQKKYRSVVAFTHFTRSVVPNENASTLNGCLTPLVAALAKNQAWQEPPRIDIVCHSRGGLVVRCLLEELEPDQVPYLSQVDKVIFVATPNGGTNLALPQNWGRLLGALSKFTRFPWVGPVVEGLFDMLAYRGEQEFPGVDAMIPNGDWLLGNLYRTHRPSHIRYYSVSGNYVPDEWLRFTTLKDILFDRVFRVANDLVVDTESVTGRTLIPGPDHDRAVGVRLNLERVLLFTDGKNDDVKALKAQLELETGNPNLVTLAERKGIDHSGYFHTGEFREFVTQVLQLD